MMSNIEATVKVAEQLLARIFDQRQFTNGEINYLVREYDKLNLEDGFNKTLKVNQDTCLVDDTYNKDLCSSQDAIVASVGEQMASLLEQTDRVLRIEGEQRRKEEDSLGETRRNQEKRRQQCLSRTSKGLEQLKNSLIDEELEFERKYLKFEETLRRKA